MVGGMPGQVGRGGWTGELMIAFLWAEPTFSFSNVSPHSLSLRASLQDLLGPSRVSDLACLSAQVDMFSYGMVLYELLSGQRPALGQHQLQIAKKLSKGIRPVLGQPEEVQFHRLQALMMECWDTKPEKVPGVPEPGASQLLQLVGAVGLQSTPVWLPVYSSLRV